MEDIASAIETSISSDEPFGIANNSWGAPELTRSELIEEAQSIINLIEELDGDSLGENEVRLKDYIRRLDHLQSQTIGYIGSHPAQAVPAYLMTLQGLRTALTPVLSSDERAEAAAKLKRLTQRIRAMESRLNNLEPRTVDLNTIVERIEQAYEAADQLPTDLDALSEAKQKVLSIVNDATRYQNDIARIKEYSVEIDKQLKKTTTDADAVLARCEHAYSAATSVGLAAAFSKRSSTLSKSIWFWIWGLVAALAAGSYFGKAQLHSLGELFGAPNVPIQVIVLNFLLSILSIGAPVWFAWLATKQIGQRFRIAEDYAYKASISQAYEGFRREAARFDKDMEAKLLTSALTRLDELPLRLVETDSHGSPWHELVSSSIVKQAMQAVPGFAAHTAGHIKELASKALATVKPAGRSGRSKPKTSTVANEIADGNE